MRRLMSTPLLIVILVAALAGAAGLGLQASTEVRTSAPTAVPPIPTATAPTPTVVPTPPPTAVNTSIATPIPPLQHFGAVRTQGHPVPAPAAVPTSSVPARVSKPAHALRYTAIGASDAVGVGADDPATQNWVADLGRLLPPGSTVLNLGVSGILTAGALQQELPRAVASQPDLVTVWLAVNDINARVPLATYNQQLSVMLKTLRTRTQAVIFVGNVPALGLLPSYRAVAGSALTAQVAQWNAAIVAVSTRYGATVIDLYTPSLLTLPTHPAYVSADGFHPSTLGYRDEAQTFWQVIRRHHGHLNLR